MLLDQAHIAFRQLVEWGILILEFFCTSVLIVTGVVSMVRWLQRKPDVRTILSQGLLLALAFKMGGEVLRTVIISELTELVSIFAIILLRGLVAAMIYWEITKEAKIETMYRSGKLPEKPPEEQQEQPQHDTVSV